MNLKTHGQTLELEGNETTPEEQLKQRQVLQQHMVNTVVRMRKIEDEVMDNPLYSAVKLNDLYIMQEKFSRHLQWLQGIEKNRFIDPERMAKIKADQEEAGKMKIVAP